MAPWHVWQNELSSCPIRQNWNLSFGPLWSWEAYCQISLPKWDSGPTAARTICASMLTVFAPFPGCTFIVYGRLWTAFASIFTVSAPIRTSQTLLCPHWHSFFFPISIIFLPFSFQSHSPTSFHTFSFPCPSHLYFSLIRPHLSTFFLEVGWLYYFPSGGGCAIPRLVVLFPIWLCYYLFITQLPSTQYPMASTKYPMPSTQYSVPNTQYPIPSTQYLRPNTQYPAPSTQNPIPTTQHSRPKNQKSLVTGKAPDNR